MTAPAQLFSSRAHLPDTPERYVFGPPAAPLLTLNDTDDQGCVWACDEPEGWDAPEFSTPQDDRPDGPGAYLGETVPKARVLSFAGDTVAPTLAIARQARTRLLQAIGSSLRGQVLYTQLDDQPAKSLMLRPTGKVRCRFVDSTALTWAFTMVAESPYKVGPTSTYGPGRLPGGGAEPGRVYPRTYPYSYGGGSAAATVVTVPNDGDSPSPAVYTINGPVPQPLIQVSSGEYLGLLLDLGAQDVAVIDTEAGTVQVNGVNRLDAYLSGSTFPTIPPGGAEVRLRSRTGGTSQAAALYVTTASTWLY